MIEDPHWPRASAWLADSTARLRAEHPPSRPDLVVLGVPAHRTSLSPTGAHETPGAIRAALARCSTWVTEPGLDLAALRVLDLGDLDEPDGADGERATIQAVRQYPDVPVLALGGDNSITYAVAHGAFADGLVTLDAHHDLRDGTSNGSPVRRLVEAGLDARRVVQVGIADFANSPQYAARARELGITVVPRGVLDRRPIADVMAEALEIASGGSPEARVHVDLDVDVCDRSVAPACPAALPGGISARQLREVARIAGADPRVVAIDVTEVDATADAPDQRTVRLAALCLLEVATGVLQRPPG
ncbi:MAG: arginase family protein [Candidatus Nanopelagicales bacterium]|jgi:formiminoglutamase|nr:arginase family protein [Candidatus Nanopelagicales bacterium]